MGATDRKAIAIASDYDSDVKIVAQLIDDLGFDPVHIGPLASGTHLQPGTKLFGASVPAAVIRQAVN